LRSPAQSVAGAPTYHTTRASIGGGTPADAGAPSSHRRWGRRLLRRAQVLPHFPARPAPGERGRWRIGPPRVISRRLIGALLGQARTRFTPYYLRSEDGGRIGTLSTQPPGEERSTTYVYDPEDPCPTIAGSHSFLRDIPGLIQAGSVDQRANESREDVLVFSTPPLEADTEVTGPIVLHLHAASTARDTDFTVKLLDVHPDGAAYNLTEGIVRARFRESIYEPPKLLTPGEVYRYRIELLPTANVFRAGHRIRIHVSSSNWPLWDRNPNTGNAQGMDAELRRAVQTIHHDAARPSHLMLPIVPRDAASRIS